MYIFNIYSKTIGETGGGSGQQSIATRRAAPHLSRSPHLRSSPGLGKHSGLHQRGFSLVEVSIVMAIVLLLSIMAIPTIQAYVIEGKVPKAGEELARFILHTKVNASGSTAAPYVGITTSNLANMMRDSSVFSISGPENAPSVKHGLGGDGAVTVAAIDAGASFSVTLSNVHHAACPSIASILQRVSDIVAHTPENGTADVIKNGSTRYNALTTESRCSHGDGNTFVFTVS